MTVSVKAEALKESQEPTLIPIDSQDGTTPTWAMIELNGELLIPQDAGKENGSKQTSHPNEFELGSLRFEGEVCNSYAMSEPSEADLSSQTPFMILGSHELKGSVEKLKRPFCLLKKEAGGASYTVTGLITTKLLFNKYPKTIMR